MTKITMAHGGGGVETRRLIDDIFAKYFKGETKSDAAVLDVGGGKIAFTTDSFVVTPLVFKGGDIGRLAVCGTVNDLLTSGATPLYLSAGFIIDEGLDIGVLELAARSMAETAAEAGVKVVTGDTKVVGRKGEPGLFINTAGVGRLDREPLNFGDLRVGDTLLVTGNLGEHHACILSKRANIENDIVSDAAPLTEIARNVRPLDVVGMRDVTRGGLGGVLSEILSDELNAEIDEGKLPVSDGVRGLCAILGLDPIYMGGEGVMLIAARGCAGEVLKAVRSSRYGENAAIIGKITEGDGNVVLNTKQGGKRLLPPPSGEGLPRIC